MIGTDVTGTTAFDPTGTDPLGNTNDGVSISSSAQGNTIGGTAAGTGNIISGNQRDGIEISGSGTSANLVAGNEIGTNAAGNAAILAAAFVTPMAATAWQSTRALRQHDRWYSRRHRQLDLGRLHRRGHKLCQWHRGRGQPDRHRRHRHARAAQLDRRLGPRRFDAEHDRRLDFRCGQPDLGKHRRWCEYHRHRDASNVIAGNKIGTDVSGTLAVPNSGDGVLINDSGSNTIGGSTSGAGNLISGNSSFGVVIEGQNAYVNVVAGNLIGTDASGTVALGNDNGVGILGADYGNTIGGSAAGWGNLISGNTETGVVINGQDVVVRSVKNVVAGNLIGTDITGTFAVPNETGVLIDDSPNNTIGGSVSGDSNLISGNTGYGIYLDFGTTGTIIVGNKIGTDIAGTLALPNSTGIFVSANDNTIGGGAAGWGI